MTHRDLLAMSPAARDAHQCPIVTAAGRRRQWRGQYPYQGQRYCLTHVRAERLKQPKVNHECPTCGGTGVLP